MKVLDLIRNKFGEVLCIASLVLYFILRLPLNLSVVCANENQGFAFVFGNGLLQWGELACGRGPVFVSLYALLIKLFGFGTHAIVAVHVLETLIFVSIGLFLYFVIKKVLSSGLYGGIATLLWVFMVVTPLGYSDTVIEIRSHWNLHGECLGMFFSLLSLLLLVSGGLFDLKTSKHSKKNLVWAGIFAVMSLMSKANNGVFLISTIVWGCLVFFTCKEKKIFIQKLLPYFLGILISGGLCAGFVGVFYPDFAGYWKDYFLVGSYFAPQVSDGHQLFGEIVKVMTRNSSYLSNLILFGLMFTSLLFGVVRFWFLRSYSKLDLLWLLVGIWGVGVICAIMLPNYYQPYYYHLAWPVTAMLICFGLYWLNIKANKKNISQILIVVLLVIFGYRSYLVLEPYKKLFNELSIVFATKQPQSFQDPVKPYDFARVEREGLLKAADLLNIHMKKTSSTLFVFNFNSPGQTAFSPLTYIYSKRFPPTTVDAALLRVPTIIATKVEMLKRDLRKRPPDYVVMPSQMYLEKWQEKELLSFFDWFNGFVQNNYGLIQPMRFTHDLDEKQEMFFLYQRKI